MDSLIAGRDELRKGLLVPAPESYKGRLIAQIALAGLLAFQCTLYLIIWVRDVRRAGKTLSIFQIKKTRGGPLVTVQALCAYILSNLLCAMAVIVDRVQLYRMCFNNVSMRHNAIADTLAISFGSLGCLAYTFSNFHPALLLMRGSDGLESTGRLWLIVYNACFGITTAAWIIAAVVITVRLDPASNALYKTAIQLLALLENVIADPSQLTPGALAQLTSYQTTLSTVGRTVARDGPAMSILGQVYCGIYAVASLGSLIFVFRLRKHARATRAILTPRYPVDSDFDAPGQGRKSSGAFEGAAVPASPANPTKLSSTSVQKRKGLLSKRNSTALERLAADLTLSVPLVLLFCIYLLIAGSYAERTSHKTGWSWTEFRNDCFTWPEVFIANPIVGYFLYNTWRAPGRYGAGNDRNFESASASARIQPSYDTHQLGPVHFTVSKHTELQGPTDDKSGTLAAADLSDHDIDLRLKKDTHWV